MWPASGDNSAGRTPADADRRRRTAALAEAIAAGTYTIDAGAIADAMLGRCRHRLRTDRPAAVSPETPQASVER